MSGVEEPEEKKNLSSPIDVGSVTKLVTVLAAMAYGTGVVAINTYLHGLGITDFSFAKPKLLLTGTMVLASFLLLSSVPYLLMWRRSAVSTQQDLRENRVLSPALLAIGIVSFGALILVAFLLCFRLETPLGQIQAWWIWERIRPESNWGRLWAVAVVVGGVYVPAWTAALAGFSATQILKTIHGRSSRTGTAVEYFRLAGATGVLLLSIIGFIMMFTFNFYPSVPVEFGGGEPYFESFAIADSQQCALRQVGIPFGANATGVTSPLPVLHEADTLVAVWLQKRAETESDSKAATETAGTRSGVVDNDTSGLGRSAVVVVQLDKASIVATKAYPHWRRVPVMAAFSGSCAGQKNEPPAK
jgi:hypothetical protein